MSNTLKVKPFTNVQNISLAMAVYLATDNYDHNDDPYTLSATTLLKPTKEIVLALRRKSEDSELGDISARIASCNGSAIHTAFEDAWVQNYAEAFRRLNYPEHVISKILINPKPEDLYEDCIPVYLEQRGLRKVGRWTISGKFDFVAEGELTDVKTTKVYGYLKNTNTDKFIKQGSIYKWLHPEIITKPTLNIEYVFLDYAAAQRAQNPNYPPSAIFNVKYPLMGEHETDAFIKAKLAEIDSYENELDQSKLPRCTPEELWQGDPIWKYYKNPNNTARSTKNFTNANEAQLRFVKDGSVGKVVRVDSDPKACGYCSALKECEQAQEYILSGALKL